MIQLNGITLNNGLQWTTEYSLQKVSQTAQRTLAGSMVVYHGQRSNGFPVHLESGNDHGWITRDTLDQVKALYEQSGLVMDLELRGESYQVIFDHSNTSALEASPVIPVSNPVDTDYYRVKLKFITV